MAQRLGTHYQVKYLASSGKFSSEINQKLVSGKYYEVLGYTQGTDLSALTDV